MRTILSALLLLLIFGCASPMKAPPAKASVVGPFGKAELMLSQGKFAEAHDEYRRIAEAEAGSPVGEEASYRAARILISFKNPSKSYALAAREFEAFLQRYPSGRFAEDAATWLAALEAIQQSVVNKLLEQVDSLTKQLEAMTAERRKTESERDSTARERDALHAERDDLKKRIEALLHEKDELLRTKTALLQERDGLSRDKTALEKKVEALTRDKERLNAAKAKLEQRLRDVTAVDVKMEKERKKIK